MNKKISAMYFSATDTTKKVVSGIAAGLAGNIAEDINFCTIDFTLPSAREKPPSFAADDIVIVGVPVYAGRVPNVLLKYLNSVAGNGALAVAVVVYGNRNYDDALIELTDILTANGFRVIAAAAFIGEHSFSQVLAKHRPDAQDMAAVNSFAEQIYRRITGPTQSASVAVAGNRPYRPYYMPKKEDGQPADIRKVTPKTNSDCTHCKLCVKLCPVGSIDQDDVTKLNGICIKCCACIKKCPVQAKYYDDENYLHHKRELEIKFAQRREPEIFL